MSVDVGLRVTLPEFDRSLKPVQMDQHRAPEVHVGFMAYEGVIAGHELHGLVGMCPGRDQHDGDDAIVGRLRVCQDKPEVRRRIELGAGEQEGAARADRMHQEPRLLQPAFRVALGADLVEDGARIVLAHALGQENFLQVDRDG